MTLVRARRKILFVLLFAGLLLCSWDCEVAGSEDTRKGLSDARSFAFQLQGVSIDALVASDYDVVVIDYSRDGTDSGAFSSADIARLKNAGKTVLAYLSIGEAESYRWYWQSSWTTSPPSWLGKENPDWAGNYKVRYWDTDWQNVILGSLDRIVAQGFDGIYLDIVDAYYYWSNDAGSAGETGPFPSTESAADDMVDWIAKLAGHARTTAAGFIICPQNATDIINDASAGKQELFWSTVNAVGAEDTFFFGENDMDNSWNPQTGVIANLDAFVSHQKKVLCIDYLSSGNAADIARFREASTRHGFLSYVADRALDTLR